MIIHILAHCGWGPSEWFQGTELPQSKIELLRLGLKHPTWSISRRNLCSEITPSRANSQKYQPPQLHPNSRYFELIKFECKIDPTRIWLNKNVWMSIFFFILTSHHHSLKSIRSDVSNIGCKIVTSILYVLTGIEPGVFRSRVICLNH